MSWFDDILKKRADNTRWKGECTIVHFLILDITLIQKDRQWFSKKIKDKEKWKRVVMHPSDVRYYIVVYI